MGSCLSKKSTNSSSAVEKPPEQTKSNVQVVVTVEQEKEKKKKKVEEETVKKEIFVIKHRKSNEIERKPVVAVEEKCEVKKGAEVTEMAKNCSSNNLMNCCSAGGGGGGGVLGLGPGSGVVVTAAAAAVAVSTAPVRTSSCTKEEVDAILIQCGRLSRSSSSGKAVTLSASAAGSGENGNSVQRGKKYSGSKRSYDFDHENGSDGGDRRRGNGAEIDGCEDNAAGGDDDDNAVVVVVGGERSNRHRQRQRQSRSVSSPSSSKGRRRRTPSRERDQAQQQQQRSGSRERVSSANGSGRRVSRSPGRRSESPITTSGGVTAANTSSSGNANGCNNGGGCKPGKMVSVPATVSSLAIDNNSNKSNNVGGTETISASAVKRIQVKRNVGCDSPMVSRTVGSPRARSPARMNAARISSENQNYSNSSAQNLQQQPLSLSRSNSRKAEQSPYRRNPLAEIDNNVAIVPAVEQMPLPAGLKAPVHKLNADNAVTDNNRVNKTIVDKNLVMNVGCKAKEQQHSVTEEIKNSQSGVSNNVSVNVVVGSGSEILKSSSHGGVTRSRSSRLSRDLDINPEALSNAAAAPSYTALLLEDIQNFHQKNTNTPAFTLPACVSKACSILEAVADLNSSTGSNYSASAAAAAFADDKRRIPLTTHQFGTPVAGKKGGVETKDPFMQSEVPVGDDDLMEPSFHKYVTVRRGGGGTLSGEEMEDQESSGSNSFVSGQQQQEHWASSSWEPNSADSTDCWTSSSSSRSHCREDSRSSVVPSQRFGLSSSDQQQNGIGRGRLGGGSRGIQSLPAAAAI